MLNKISEYESESNQLAGLATFPKPPCHRVMNFDLG